MTKHRIKQAVLFLIVGVVLGLLLLTPPVWRLKRGESVTVTRWIPPAGKVRVAVGPKEKGWTPIRGVSRHSVFALVVAEDQRFFDHWGLDPVEIWHSLEVNMRRGGYVRGASTITQQVVRNALLDRDKNLWRKFREALGAFLLELIASKDEIMEWYVNLVELGTGVYGIKQGAQVYFQTRPDLLTINQSIHLALVLPSPNVRAKALRVRQLSPKGRYRFAHLLVQLRNNGYITQSQWEQSMATGNFGSPIEVSE